MGMGDGGSYGGPEQAGDQDRDRGDGRRDGRQRQTGRQTHVQSRQTALLGAPCLTLFGCRNWSFLHGGIYTQTSSLLSLL